MAVVCLFVCESVCGTAGFSRKGLVEGKGGEQACLTCLAAASSESSGAKLNPATGKYLLLGKKREWEGVLFFLDLKGTCSKT